MEKVFFIRCPECKRVFAVTEKQINYTHGSGTWFFSCPQKYTREERLAKPSRKSFCTGYPEYPKCQVDEKEYKEYIACHPEHFVEDQENMASAKGNVNPKKLP